MTTAEALRSVAEGTAKIAEDLERLAGEPRHRGQPSGIRWLAEARAFHLAAREIERLAERTGA